MIRFLLILLIPVQLFAQSNMDQVIKLVELRKFNEARKILLAIPVKDQLYDRGQYQLGRIAMAEQDFETAAGYFENAINVNDQVAEYYAGLGDAYGGIAQDANPIRQGILATRMKSAWEKSITMNPKLIEPRQSLIQFYMRAPGFMGGDIEKAKEMARELKKLKPALGHLEMGNICLFEKRVNEAEQEFLEMVKADTSFVYQLGSFYVQQKQWNKAFDVFEKVVKQNNTNFPAIYQIGRISALSGIRLERGEECLKKYFAYQPKQNEPPQAAAKMRLAQIMEKKGNIVEAKKLYQDALKQDPSLKEAKEGLERVSK